MFRVWFRGGLDICSKFWSKVCPLCGWLLVSPAGPQTVFGRRFACCGNPRPNIVWSGTPWLSKLWTKLRTKLRTKYWCQRPNIICSRPNNICSRVQTKYFLVRTKYYLVLIWSDQILFGPRRPPPTKLFLVLRSPKSLVRSLVRGLV